MLWFKQTKQQLRPLLAFIAAIAGMAPASSLQPLLTHAKTIVVGISSNSKGSSGLEEAVQQLKSVTFAITSAGRQNKTLSAEEETAIWDLVCSLWVRIAADLLSAVLGLNRLYM